MPSHMITILPYKISFTLIEVSQSRYLNTSPHYYPYKWMQHSIFNHQFIYLCNLAYILRLDTSLDYFFSFSELFWIYFFKKDWNKQKELAFLNLIELSFLFLVLYNLEASKGEEHYGFPFVFELSCTAFWFHKLLSKEQWKWHLSQDKFVDFFIFTPNKTINVMHIYKKLCLYITELIVYNISQPL